MPLVQFQYRESNDIGTILAPADSSMKINLPKRAQAANWHLKEVNVVHFSPTPQNVRHVEIDFPELMHGNHVMYSLNSQMGTSPPNRALRFYMNRYQNDQAVSEIQAPDNNPSNLRSTISHPDLDLGYHHIESGILTLNLKLRVNDANATPAKAYMFSIILEYNE